MARSFWWRTTFLCLLVSGLCACSSHSDSPSSSKTQVDQANDLIDQGKPTEAIQMLLEVRKTDNSPRVAQVLASAYAARAGIKVENYWGFVVGYSPLLKSSDSNKAKAAVKLIDPGLLPKNTPAQVSKFVDQINDNTGTLLEVRDRINQIPYVDPQPRQDLQEAVNVLTDVSTQGAHLYRAVLETVLLRCSLEDTVKIAIDWGKKPADLCSRQTSLLLQWLRYSKQTLTNDLNDIGQAYPDKADEFQKYAAPLKSFEIPQTENTCPADS